MTDTATALRRALETNPVCLTCGDELDHKSVVMFGGLCHRCRRGVKTATRKRPVPRERAKLKRNKTLRARVFERDRWTCQNCGFKPGSSPFRGNVHLSIDHIVPVSKGGKTVEANLQTLCQTCNNLKDNKPEEYEKKGRRFRAGTSPLGRAARTAHGVWDAEIAGSNPAPATNAVGRARMKSERS